MQKKQRNATVLWWHLAHTKTARGICFICSCRIRICFGYTDIYILFFFPMNFLKSIPWVDFPKNPHLEPYHPPLFSRSHEILCPSKVLSKLWDSKSSVANPLAKHQQPDTTGDVAVCYCRCGTWFCRWSERSRATTCTQRQKSLFFLGAEGNSKRTKGEDDCFFFSVAKQDSRRWKSTEMVVLFLIWVWKTTRPIRTQAAT